jgi:hypothetical protein
MLLETCEVTTQSRAKHRVLVVVVVVLEEDEA